MGIDVEGIERQLTATWAEMTGGRAEGGEAGVTRACALNLVVCARDAGEREEIEELLAEVFERNPCRAIVIVADAGAAEPGMEAYVSTRCAVSSKGAKQVCGEQITVEAAGASVASAASAVAPLLAPDVPVFLWWKDIPHYEDKLFRRLVETADRVVIDSATFDAPHEDLKRLATLISERGERLALTDLNWGRLTSWRALVASFWDVFEYRPLLAAATDVEIIFEPPPLAPSEIAPKALLALGWLASRLGWESAAGTRLEGGAARFDFKTKTGGELRALLRPADADECGGGMLRRLTIKAEGAEFFVELKDGGAKLETGTRAGAGERALGRVLAYEAASEGRRLGRELSILSRDLVYEASVATAARLLDTFGS
ncbi:MAG TPA: glucose-6-phosphate dehydrogenase assembly protein OpcA [Pyrinomonadaceae bacterium]|nr:glucose-6-phosphate dehydrogenase assembly protein OpcA [Pyrinomonadaceae bacterium]